MIPRVLRFLAVGTVGEGHRHPRLFERLRVPALAGDRFCDYIFYAGIWLRFVVFGFLDPFNTDSPDHFEHLMYVKRHWLLPPAGLGETWQPPLYYFISALFASISENPKFIQSFSLVTSVATLLVAREFVRSTALLRTREGKALALSIVSLAPIFVTFGLCLSNDSLATLLGFAAIHKSEQLLRDRRTKTFFELVGILTLGLLTKGQFLVITACLFPYACCCYWHHESSRSKKIFVCVGACGLFALGSVKYIQNSVLYGRPFVCNMDFSPQWLLQEQGSYHGLASACDINILKLVRNPIWTDATQHSIPLVLYGTFWYDYFGQTGLIGYRLHLSRRIGSYLDLVGGFPAVFLILGVAVALGSLIRWTTAEAHSINGLKLLKFAVVGTFLGNILMLLLVFRKFDAACTLQARYLFPTLIGAFVLCDIAVNWANKKSNMAPMFNLWQVAYITAALCYFGTELGLQILTAA